MHSRQPGSPCAQSVSAVSRLFFPVSVFRRSFFLLPLSFFFICGLQGCPCLLPTAYCLLPTAYCLLSFVFCLLLFSSLRTPASVYHSSCRLPWVGKTWGIANPDLKLPQSVISMKFHYRGCQLPTANCLLTFALCPGGGRGGGIAHCPLPTVFALCVNPFFSVCIRVLLRERGWALNNQTAPALKNNCQCAFPASTPDSPGAGAGC